MILVECLVSPIRSLNQFRAFCLNIIFYFRFFNNDCVLDDGNIEAGVGAVGDSDEALAAGGSRLPNPLIAVVQYNCAASGIVDVAVDLWRILKSVI